MPDIDSPVIPDLDKVLNNILTVKEVLLAIDNLKNGKAPGEDRILNEMLKAGKITLADSLCKIFNLVFESEKYPYIWSIHFLVPVFKGGISDNPDNYRGISISSCVGKLYSSVLHNRLADSLCKIFNLVFASGKYPYIWSTNFLVPVFKGGISDNPDNYRGISISSCVGELYSSVLYNRLIDAIEKFGLLSNNQIGFLKGYMTTDYSFIINSLANHFTKIMKKDLYIAFVDLRKAYDTVNRGALISKLYNKGITGKFLKNIRAMLQEVQQKLKIDGHILPTMISEIGLKQGDNLSPIEFDFFFDDVGDIFDDASDPVPFDTDKHLSHLAFADDLALFSLSKAGLQRCLDNLSNYCKKWGLEVSIKKTKALVVNQSGRIPEDACFFYNHKLIETVNRFSYLGSLVTSNGSTGSQVPGKEELREKADKAYFSLQRVLGRIKYEARLSMDLFKKLVEPILTYNCEILNQIPDKKIDQLLSGEKCLEDLYSESPSEKLNLHLCRNILGLSKKSSSLAVLGELGQFPIEILCFTKMIKYWHRLKTKLGNKSSNSLFFKAS